MKKLFVVKDNKAGYCYPPTLYKTNLEAQRALENAVNSGDKKSLFCTNPEDFSFFEIGEYDETTGMITPKEKNHICDLSDLVKVE